MRVHWNTWGRMSQAWNLGYEIDGLVCVQLLEKLSEMVHRDASECARGSAWSYCTWARFFLLEEGSRQLWHHLVMSLSFCLCRGLGVYKGEHTWAGGWSPGSFGSCTSKLPLEKPPTLCCSYFGASWGVWVQLTGRCSSFVQLYVPKVIPGTLSWYWFSCLQVNQVVCLISHRPCIRVTWTATFWSELAHAG